MKNKGNKSLLALVLAALLLTVAVSGTLAYLVDRTQTVTNTFTPTQVDIEVKNDYTIENVNNPKNVDAYVRAAVLVNWKLGNDVFGVEPTGHTLTLNTKSDTNNSAWVKYGDFYYYTQKVPVGTMTSALVKTFDANGLTPPAAGFELKVEILAQAIQAEPKDAVKDAWDVDPEMLTQ